MMANVKSELVFLLLRKMIFIYHTSWLPSTFQLVTTFYLKITLLVLFEAELKTNIIISSTMNDLTVCSVQTKSLVVAVSVIRDGRSRELRVRKYWRYVYEPVYQPHLPLSTVSV